MIALIIVMLGADGGDSGGNSNGGDRDDGGAGGDVEDNGAGDYGGYDS